MRVTNLKLPMAQGTPWSPSDRMVAGASCWVDAFHHRTLGYLVNIGRSIKRWNENTQRDTARGRYSVRLPHWSARDNAAGTMIRGTWAKATHEWLRFPVCRLQLHLFKQPWQEWNTAFISIWIIYIYSFPNVYFHGTVPLPQRPQCCAAIFL